MSKFCRYLGIINAILGGIGSICIGLVVNNINNNLSEISYADNATIGLPFAYFLTVAFVTCIISAVLLGIAEVLDRLDSVQYAVKEMNRENMGGSRDGYTLIVPGSQLMQESWKCECGRENPIYVTSCACGRCKPD